MCEPKLVLILSILKGANHNLKIKTKPAGAFVKVKQKGEDEGLNLVFSSHLQLASSLLGSVETFLKCGSQSVK